MVKLLGVTPSGSSKEEHIRQLEKVLFTPKAIQSALKQLTPKELAALQAIQRADGKILSGRLRMQLVRAQVVNPQEKRSYYGESSFNIHAPPEQRVTYESVVGRLIALGLVWAQEYTNNFGRTKIYYDNFVYATIPPEVLAELPPPPPVQETSAVSSDMFSHIQESSARAFQRDLYFYWSTVRAEPLHLTTQGRVYKKDLTRVNNALQKPENSLGDEPDMPRLIFMRRLMTELGILRVRNGQVEAIELPKFLSQPPAIRVERTFKAWRDGKFWNEVLSIQGISTHNIGTRLNDAPPQIVQARQTVLEHIAGLHRAHPDWILLDALVDSLRSTDYEFLLPRNYKSDYGYYYYYTQHSPYTAYGNPMHWEFGLRSGDEAEGWEYVEANFIRAIVLEPLHWMGLVDIGYVDGKPFAWRLTELGAWVMGVGSEIKIPEGEGKVIVQPNYEIIALDPISDMALARLDEFADRTSSERAMQYVLSRESVYRAQKKGWTVNQIIELLQKMSDSPLPQNVERTLREWQALHERITIRRRASVLQAADASLLDTLFATPSVGRHLAERRGETVALVAAHQTADDDLLAALHEMGHLPARTASTQDVLRPSLTIDPNGEIHFREALPSIFLFGLIAPFTEVTPDHRYRLTEAAVKQALASDHSTGYTVEKILDTLRTLHIGPLPRPIEIKIRAWGHDYGDAAIQPLILVQVQDEPTLKKLMEEPELQGLLSPFTPDPKKKLAVISADRLEQLRQAFQERGMNIKDILD